MNEALGDSQAEQLLQVLLGERLSLEELLHEIVVRLGDGLVGELLTGGLGGFLVLGGDLIHVLAVTLVVVGLHADDVHDAVEIGFGSKRYLYRHYTVAERRGQLRHERR